MSALEIILTSVLGGAVIITVVYIIVYSGLRVNKAHTYRTLNARAKKGQIVFFGDSLTDFYPLQEFFDEPTIYNRGIAGDTTDDLLDRMDNVIDLQPRKIFLLIGTNDIGSGRSVDRTVGNVGIILDKLTAECPGCRIYMMSQYPVKRNRNIYSFFVVAVRTQKRLKELNGKLRLLAEERGIPYINVTDVLTDKKGEYKKNLTVDGLHTNVDGYCLVSDVLEPYIKE